MASSRVTAIPPAAETKAPVPNTAGEILERAFSHFHFGEHRTAIDLFTAAVATGHLNDSGRVLAYWHIFMAERALGNANASTEAAAAFISVAQDILSPYLQNDQLVLDAGSFASRFDLPGRLTRARATVAAAWSERSGTFGKSLEHPVPINNPSEITYFLEMVGACAEASDRVVVEIDHPKRMDKKIRHQHETPVQHLNVSCRAGSGDYFFDLGPVAAATP